MTLSDNMRGAALMVGAMTGFTVNDAFMKALSDELPLFQAVFLRGVAMTLCLVLLARLTGQWRWRVAPRDRALIALRSLAEVGAAYFFISALFHMPIANVTAILQVLPLSVTLAAALVFREPLGWRRLTAIVVGFAGVLLIVRPGAADFNSFSLWALAAVGCVTVRDLAARRLSRDVPSLIVSIVTAVCVSSAAGIAAAFAPWAPVSGQAVLQLSGAVVFVCVGYVCAVAAMRVGEIGVVAPFRYSSLLVALILGVAVFGEFPKPVTLLGAAIVVATGVFTLYRESRLHRTAAAGPGRIR